MRKLLTVAESKKLEKYIEGQGGQVQASVLLGPACSTLSRTINRRTAPSVMLRKKLIEVGVLAEEEKDKS